MAWASHLLPVLPSTRGWLSLACVLAAVCVQLRLLCNLLDGMVAIEHGQQSPTGPLYNEVPDRVADTLFLVAAGYLALSPTWGWAAALAAMFTAYIRAFGASLGQAHNFSGPMAKPHRMATLTLALLVYALYPEAMVMQAALGVIAAGALLTCWHRLRAIARQMS